MSGTRRKPGATGRKHHLSFETTRPIFADPFAVTVVDPGKHGEERWHTFGRIWPVLVVVVHTIREERGEEVYRIISARRATARERGLYEEG